MTMLHWMFRDVMLLNTRLAGFHPKNVRDSEDPVSVAEGESELKKPLLNDVAVFLLGRPVVCLHVLAL